MRRRSSISGCVAAAPLSAGPVDGVGAVVVLKDRSHMPGLRRCARSRFLLRQVYRELSYPNESRESRRSRLPGGHRAFATCSARRPTLSCRYLARRDVEVAPEARSGSRNTFRQGLSRSRGFCVIHAEQMPGDDRWAIKGEIFELSR